MNRLPSILLIAIATGALVAFVAMQAAAQSFEPDENGSTPEADSDDRADLAWAFQEGDVFYARETDSQVQVQTFMGQTEESKEETTTFMRYVVSSVDDDGVATIESHFDGIAMRSSSQGGEVEYDSRNPEHAELEGLPEIRPVAMLVGQSFRFRVNSEGSVSDVKGYDEIFTELLEDMRRDAPQFIELFETMFSNEFMQQQLQMMFDILPGEEVAGGDEWEQTGEQWLPALGTLNFTNAVTYHGNERNDNHELANLSVTGELDFEADQNSSIFPEGTELSIEDTEVEGEVQYNLDLGWFEKTESNMSMVMRIDLGDGMELTQNQENVTEVQRLSAEEWAEALGIDEDAEDE